MSLKKRSLIFSIFLIIIIQILLYINNNQKSTFRYFIWNIKEVKIGRLISFSFISGLLVSSILNIPINTNVNNKYSDDYEDEDQGKNYLENDEKKKYSDEIPPQRDIRDTQPTISVNYRVIKNNEEKEGYSNNPRYQDDWLNNDNEW